ncbi:hypothetical protein HPB48_021769 [Haemaphysalis longicornis]|uniref:Serine hydrolase domain-containing protein n=1 Tax=Haemaphysalis longicornis TaxID=44386 RepID=A0A9J6GB39_HAELO|nr:hypothetical protein HPB48_021769 [Haemaphysalis longicornis]
MSSDPIAAMFGFVKRSAGCDDALDVKSATCSLENMLKTGIISASSGSNVQKVECGFKFGVLVSGFHCEICTLDDPFVREGLITVPTLHILGEADTIIPKGGCERGALFN